MLGQSGGRPDHRLRRRAPWRTVSHRPALRGSGRPRPRR
jgi:hypothetical protein